MCVCGGHVALETQTVLSLAALAEALSGLRTALPSKPSLDGCTLIDGITSGSLMDQPSVVTVQHDCNL